MLLWWDLLSTRHDITALVIGQYLNISAFHSLCTFSLQQDTPAVCGVTGGVMGL